MTAHYETLLVDAGGPSEGLLSPGRVLRALHQGAGISAEEVGAMRPEARGIVAIDVLVERARRVATPSPLPVRDDATHRDALLVLRRADDAETDEDAIIHVRALDGGALPAPGALAVALSAASGGAYGAEAVGAVFAARDALRVTLPLAWATSDRLPDALEVAGRPFALEPAGKKKP
ncbi:MAG: hypothetical protein H6745_16220 [Deltaproteobacteria bacterium]|nr:hypothetical protein [Deltaproteobacteria bacterium]